MHYFNKELICHLSNKCSLQSKPLTQGWTKFRHEVTSTLNRTKKSLPNNDGIGARLGNFLRLTDGDCKNLNKLNILINSVSSEICELCCDTNTCDPAIEILKSVYDKQRNEICARHKLSTRKQPSGETLDSWKLYEVQAKVVSFVKFPRTSIGRKRFVMLLQMA